MPITATQRAVLTRPGTVLSLVTDDAGAARLVLVRRKSRRPVREIQDLLNRLQQEHGLIEAVERLRQACRPELLHSGRQRGLSLDPLIETIGAFGTVVRVSTSRRAREAACPS